MNLAALLHHRNFPCLSEAYMWQCQSQYINRCNRVQWCNPDLWLRLATHGIGKKNTYPLTCFIQLALSGLSSVLSTSKCVNQSPVSSSSLRLKNACGPLSCLQLLGVTHAELSSSRVMECCFQQLGSSPPIVFSSLTNTPLTSDL